MNQRPRFLTNGFLVKRYLASLLCIAFLVVFGRSLSRLVDNQQPMEQEQFRRRENTIFRRERIKILANDGVNTKSSVDRINHETVGFRKVKDLQVFIFSVIGVNTTAYSQWDNFVLNGWEVHALINSSYDCCYFYQDGTIERVPLTEKRHFNFIGWCHVEAKQFVCPNPGDRQKSALTGVTLALSALGWKCPYDPAHYIPPVLPVKRPKPEFAICAKVVYGNKTASELIEWFEVQKLYGVSKIVLYPYLKTLNKAALQVLYHYETEGLAELIPFSSVPMNETYSRAFGYGWGFEMFHDEQVMLFDCQERLRAYRYAGFIDTDEFITTAHADTYVQMMDDLFERSPNSSGFNFFDHMHILTWGVSNPGGDMLITRYRNHTKLVLDTPKNVVRMDRVQPGSLQTHEHKPLSGFHRTTVKSGYVVIHHYAVCREAWLEDKTTLPNMCMAGFERIPGTTMEKIAEKIHPSVQAVKRKLKIV